MKHTVQLFAVIFESMLSLNGDSRTPSALNENYTYYDGTLSSMRQLANLLTEGMYVIVLLVEGSKLRKTLKEGAGEVSGVELSCARGARLGGSREGRAPSGSRAQSYAERHRAPLSFYTRVPLVPLALYTFPSSSVHLLYSLHASPSLCPLVP